MQTNVREMPECVRRYEIFIQDKREYKEEKIMETSKNRETIFKRNGHWYHDIKNTSEVRPITIANYLLPNGTRVVLPDGGIGIIDGNDAETSEEFENINYYVCPIEFTSKKVWSPYYQMIRITEVILNQDQIKRTEMQINQMESNRRWILMKLWIFCYLIF